MIAPSKPKQQHQVFHCTNSQTPSNHQKWQVGAKKQTIVFSNAIQEHFSRSLLGLFLKFYAIVHFLVPELSYHTFNFQFCFKPCHFINQSYSIC